VPGGVRRMTPSALPPLAVTIHPMRDAERGFVFHSWRRCFLGVTRESPRGNTHLADMPRRLYDEEQGRLIERLIGQPGVQVLVAEPADVEDLAVGWVCGCPSTLRLDFLYVSSIYRQRGVATSLMGACFAGALGVMPIMLSHWTRVAHFYMRRWKLVYNPYVLREV